MAVEHEANAGAVTAHRADDIWAPALYLLQLDMIEAERAHALRYVGGYRTFAAGKAWNVRHAARKCDNLIAVDLGENFGLLRRGCIHATNSAAASAMTRVAS